MIAAESLGLGSCYIGDIMENYEAHRDLFALPRYVFPICLLCMGYPTAQQRARPLTTRFEENFIVFQDRYRQLDPHELEEMFREMEERASKIVEKPAGVENAGQWMYTRKFAAAFSVEMSRSVRAILQAWTGT